MTVTLYCSQIAVAGAGTPEATATVVLTSTDNATLIQHRSTPEDVNANFVANREYTLTLTEAANG